MPKYILSHCLTSSVVSSLYILEKVVDFLVLLCSTYDDSLDLKMHWINVVLEFQLYPIASLQDEDKAYNRKIR
jgi:hypothetical protein